MLRRDALGAAPLPRGLAALLELFDRGCHSADRPHLGQAPAVLPRAAHPVNRAGWRMVQCTIALNQVNEGRFAEP